MTAAPDRSRRRLLAAAAAAPLASLVAACAGAPGTSDGPPAPAPVLKAGDRWTYRSEDGFREALTWNEVREVVAVGPGGIDLRVTQKGRYVDNERVERWTSPGDMSIGTLFASETRRFARPLPRWRFPLAPGDSWSAFASNVNESTSRAGTINYYARVGGWKSVATPAGAFDAIAVRVLIQLDDEEFWRTATECNYLFWYAPAAGATVREERDAQYYDKGDPLSRAIHRSQHGVTELVTFRRG